MYVRGIHDFNDSRVEQSERWVPADEGDELGKRFPFVFDLGADPGQGG